MNPSSKPTPKLQPSAEDLLHKHEKEQRSVLMQRETDLQHSLRPFRVGSVSYLNAVPLTRGLESEIVFATPAKLAEMLRRNELDAALVSITEVLFNDCYDVLDGIAVASLGEVKSVLLAHRKPLAEITEVFCDPASLTSVNLLKVLLGEQGLSPRFSPLASYEAANSLEAVLLIGDPAIHFLRTNPSHQIYDLGAAWFELTRLPFVYAAWALRRGLEHRPLGVKLREARDFGLDTLEYIITSRTEFDLDFRKDYLGWHIQYHLGSEEKRGIAKFIELLRKHNLRPIFEPHWLD
jgi:chorismate dehydratase